MSDSSSNNNNNSQGYLPGTYYRSLNASVMTIAVTTLFLVVFFIMALHIYAKWFWRRSFADGAADAAADPHNRRQSAATGLNKATIDLLPTFTYSESAAVQLRLSAECAVCLSEFQENDTGRLLPSCNHCFHTECIDMWFYSHSTCPLCRTEVKPVTAAEETEDSPSPEQQNTAVEIPESSAMDTAQALQPTQGSSHGHSHVIAIDVASTSEGEQQMDMSNSNQSEQGGSVRTAGLRNSIKRMLSRRVSEPNAETPKDTAPLV